MCVFGCCVLSTGYGRLNVLHFSGVIAYVGRKVLEGVCEARRSPRLDVAVRDWVGFLPDVELHTQVLAAERCWRGDQCSLGRNRNHSLPAHINRSLSDRTKAHIAMSVE